MVETFKGTPYDTGLNQDILAEINEYFGKIREEAMASGLLNPKVLGVNINTLRYQVPGGMLSNMISQLKEQNAEDKYEEVLKEIPRVRKDLGEPPLVTPSSQIVGTQAVLNVLMGERYKVATKETKSILLVEYGQTVKPFNLGKFRFDQICRTTSNCLIFIRTENFFHYFPQQALECVQYRGKP